MATSRYKTILLKSPDGTYTIVSPDQSQPYVGQRVLGFPIYRSDLVLELDRYPEYELIKHLSCKDIFNYFIQGVECTK